MKIGSFIRHLFHSQVIRFATLLLIMPAWSSLACCGEIHDAVLAGDLQKVTTLLRKSPKQVSSKDKDGATPLHLAAEKGFKKIAELLLANQANVSATDNIGSTPLHKAAWKGSKDVVEMLLAKGADIDAKTNSLDLMDIPFFTKIKEIRDLMLVDDAEGGFTPLHMAVGYGHKNVVEFLLANKAKVNAMSDIGCSTPLHIAAVYGYKDIAELLIARGADVNARNNLGMTPLREVAQIATGKVVPEPRRAEIIELLRQHGGHE